MFGVSQLMAAVAVAISGPTAWYLPGWFTTAWSNPIIGSIVKEKILTAALTVASQPLEEEALRVIKQLVDWTVATIIMPLFFVFVMCFIGVFCSTLNKLYYWFKGRHCTAEPESSPVLRAIQEQIQSLERKVDALSPAGSPSGTPNPGNSELGIVTPVKRDVLISELKEQLRQTNKLHDSLSGYVRPIGDEAARAQHRARQLEAEIAELQKVAISFVVFP